MAPARDDLAARFRRFAARECRGVSALYEALAIAVGDDSEILRLAAVTRPGQPVPNLLFAAVYFLLLEEAAKAAPDPLAAFYGTLTETPSPAAAAWPAFRNFCLARREPIAVLLRARAVNTNEVGRAACLMPAFAHLGRRVGPAPLHFVEIGASAGLLLNWDRYGYDYGSGGVAGDRGSPLRLECQLRGRRPDLEHGELGIGRRIGIDAHPIEVRRPDDRRWLRALVWPDQPDRLRRLDRALELLEENPPELITGDGTALLPEIVAALPAGEAVCVYHAFTRNQFDDCAEARFEAALNTLAAERPLHHVSLEWEAAAAPLLRLIDFQAGGDTLLARADAHGTWLEWLAE